MKKMFAVFSLVVAGSASAFAAQETCYQVSASETAWSRTPESLCLLETGDREFTITLKSGLPFSEQEIAKFNLTLLQQARCMDCNANMYGVANPSNSTFNALAIRFNGKFKRGPADGRVEFGTVSIGETKLFYRSARH